MKTISLKKVSAVAVASLGFGLLSVVPANAGAVSVAGAITLTASTSPAVGSNVSVTVKTTVPAMSASSDTVTLSAYISAKPAGASGVVKNDQTADSSTCDYGDDDSTYGGTTDLTVTYATSATCAAGVNTLGTVIFAPSVAGKYTITVWNEVATGGITIGEEVQTIDITVAATPVVSVGSSTIYSNQDGTFGGAPTSITSLVPVFQAKATAIQAANYLVTLVNQKGTALNVTDGTLSVEVSGPGLLTITDSDGGYTYSTGKSRYVTLDTMANNVANVNLFTDGTAGKSTLTFKWEDADAAVTTLATKTAVFYGAPATVTATQNLKIGKSTANTLGGSAAAPTGADNANTPAVTLTVKDKDGNLVSDLVTGSFVVVSSDASVMSTGITATESNGTGAGDAYAGPGNYNIQVNSSTNTSGKAATLTFKTLGADGVTYVSSAAVPFTLGGTPSTASLALDKASYGIGAAAVATLTVKDSAGNPVWDGDHTGFFASAAGLTTTLSITKTLYGATALTTSAGAAVAKFNAPSVSGTLTATGTALTTPVSALTATATVVDNNNAALITQIDALNAKIVALNALIAKIMKKLGVK